MTSQENEVAADGNNKSESFDPSCFHVVALGASAGGLESLEEFFSEMPADSGMAFVVLQHLSPDFRSLMDELLARHTKMPIHKAADDMQVEANSIYLNPPRKNMIISGGQLYLSDVDPNESPSLPIDQFFRSLAQDYRRQAIAVVLSGTGSDGSRGARDVYEAGGLVIAETEETAKFDGMPRAAQETGCVHLVLPPDAMPEALQSYVNQALSPQDFAEKVFVPPRLGGMETIFRLLRDEYSIDFSYYKPNTVVRRVERRVSLMHSGSIDEYVDRVSNDPEELNALYRDLLIGVTRFFRDREAFEYLKSEVLQELIDEKSEGDELRIWIAGCATGEEAYSVAILVDEVVREKGINLDIKIFATDVHPTSLEIASAGLYPNESFAQVNEERMRRYFRATPEGYLVSNTLRQMIVFARHNVFKDAPFTKLDLVTCRNLLIYLQPLAQKKALSLFHFGLRARGILLLGPSESPGELKDEFETCNNRWKVYRKRRDIRLPAELRLPLNPGPESVRSQPVPAQTAPAAPQRSLLSAYDKLLEHYISSAFLIDDARNLLHVFGDAKAYLQSRSGRVSTDLLDMVRPELKPVMASALQRVRKSTESNITTAVHLDDAEARVELKIRVMKLTDTKLQQDWFIVTLEERQLKRTDNPTAVEMSAAKISQDRVDDLETELRYTKESLQTTVEELETSNEELQATNEELVASNEELQSTNEELHSVNEELYTVNAEYQNKIAELTELSADMDSLLESTEIGTIFLDEHLSIRKFTGRVEKWFDLVGRDAGRKISTFSNSLNYTDLISDLEAVLQNAEPLEREIQDRSGKWLHLRLHPYRREGDPSGVVMTLIDVSSLKQTRAKLQRLSAIVESSDDAIIGKSFTGRIESWNQAAERLFGYSASEAVGQQISLILPKESSDEANQYFEQIRRGESVDAIETRRQTKDGRIIDIAVRFSPIRDESGGVTGMSAICRDISQRKNAEREVRRLALVAQHTDNSVVITDAEGYTEWVNEGFTRITGYQLAELRGRKPGHVLQGPESDPAVVSHMREMIAAGKGFHVEIVNYTKEKQPYWLAIDAQPLRDAEDNISGFMAIQRDVSELKKAQSQALEEVTLRDKFLAMLSHELRNPLSAIKNGLELLHDSTDLAEEERREFEGMLRAQVAQISRLLDDLLDVSRITQDKVLIQKQKLDLRKPAKEAVAAAKAFAEQREIEIKLNLPETPIYVHGDAARLQQVQANLLTNAVRHSQPGESVSLSLSAQDGQAIIQVQDNGDGIDPELHARIFDLFFQTNTEFRHANSDGGLGLGLSLVKEFVARHDGEIQVDSEGLGKGAQFTVTLPLVHGASLVEEQQPLPQEAGALKVVIVEDQMANRLILKALLQSDGHEVWEAANGKDGIETIERHQPDLALVDIGLPDISGYQVAQTIRSRGMAQETLLVALTGYGQQDDIAQAKAAGFASHFVKPLDRAQLAKLTDSLYKTTQSE